jgi:hypothetical protein
MFFVLEHFGSAVPQTPALRPIPQHWLLIHALWIITRRSVVAAKAL